MLAFWVCSAESYTHSLSSWAHLALKPHFHPLKGCREEDSARDSRNLHPTGLWSGKRNSRHSAQNHDWMTAAVSNAANAVGACGCVYTCSALVQSPQIPQICCLSDMYTYCVPYTVLMIPIAPFLSSHPA